MTELNREDLDARNQKEVRGAALYLMEILIRHFDFCPACYFSVSSGELKMADEPPAASLDRELTTNIVAAYVR